LYAKTEKGSFLLWNTAEKNDTTQHNVLNLTSQDNIGKSSLLNIKVILGEN
jgi:hypothetical protein